MIYLSTDYVFDGTQPPYKVNAEPNPLNTYGKTKRAGEKVVLEVCPLRAIVLRVPILYGQVESLGESAVTVLCEQLRKAVADEQPKLFDNWATRYPTNTADIARVLEHISRLRDKFASEEHAVSRVYHFSATEAFSKYTIAQLMAKLLYADDEAARAAALELIKPNPDPPSGAPRPRDCRMDTSALSKMLGGDEALTCVPFAKGLADALSQH
eukprot:TRINITY_DN48717_c0_g1_i1.p1 TRINITY_DN48717_c0_g1~~TRINITY_DN48717_c0_g1_i1.p1  ORF type:complete len:212 (-),score=108.89 TRINITY_DN48717_c0_g1_i1:73-708(-)